MATYVLIYGAAAAEIPSGRAASRPYTATGGSGYPRDLARDAATVVSRWHGLFKQQ